MTYIIVDVELNGAIQPYDTYVEYKAIEYIEIPYICPDPKSDAKRSLSNLTNHLIHIQKVIDRNGQFLIQLAESGLRIIGYAWL